MPDIPPEDPRRAAGPPLSARLGALLARRETIRYLVASNLKGGHRDKLLGRLWSLLDPLLFIGVYFLVFGLMFGQSSRGRSGDFLLYLCIGVVGWRFTDAAISQATTCIRTHRGLIHEINFPKAVLPVSLCLARLSDFLWAVLVVAAAVLALHPTGLTPAAAWFPVVLLLHAALSLGLMFCVAYVGAFYADTVNVVAVGMRMWFYMSPVFYRVQGPDGLVPPAWRTLYYALNPVAIVLDGYRSALLDGTAPPLWQLTYLAVLAGAVLVGGFAVFTGGEGKFAKYV